MEKLIQITSGRGPAECCWVVAQVLKLLMQDAKTHSIECSVINKEKGTENGTLASVLIRLKGKEIEKFTDSWLGTIQWVGQSKFRKHHKRKNWYVGVNELKVMDKKHSFHEHDIRFEFTRAGGPGGQHVNKVSTAVRATHLPSKTKVFVSNHRSQLQNKKEAIQLLEMKLKEKSMQELKTCLLYTSPSPRDA